MNSSMTVTDTLVSFVDSFSTMCLLNKQTYNHLRDYIFWKSGVPLTSKDNALSSIVWLVGRNLLLVHARLNNHDFLIHEFRRMRAELLLINQLDEHSYAAAHVVRGQLAALLHPDKLPPHAQEKHVRALCTPDHKKQRVEQCLAWRRRYGEHTALGNVCLSLTCNDNHFCVTARKRTVLGKRKQQEQQQYHMFTPDMWRHIVSFLEDDLDTLSSLLCASKLTAAALEHLAPLVRHHIYSKRLENLATTRLHERQRLNMTWQAPCSLNYDSFSQLLHEVNQARAAYATVFLQLQHTLARYSTEERQRLLDEFIRHAALYDSVSGSHREHVARGLKCLDYRLLEMFAFDVLTLHDDVVHSLPPRTFYHSSKHRKNYRRQFTTPDAYSSSRGATVLFSIETMREDLRQQKRLIYRKLRAVESFEVAHIQRLMDELRDMGGLLSIHATHPCALLSSTCNALLPHDELQTLVDTLVANAESHTDNDVYAVVHDLRQAIRAKIDISAFMPKLFRGFAPFRQDFSNWRLYMSSLLKDGPLVTIRIATAVKDDDDLDVLHGFALCYTHTPAVTTSSTSRKPLQDLIHTNSLAVYGVERQRWPTINNRPHATIVWGDGYHQDALVLLRDDTTETRAFFDLFAATESNVLQTLKRHARLTGKCAPCGRSLRGKNVWIGTTCAGHLPACWRDASVH